MSNLRTVEIKAFVPARDFALSKRFYQDLGFAMASDSDGIAYFHHGETSFLLQDFYNEALAKYGVKVSPVEQQPWRMRDFVVIDPSGVLWRIAQNTD